MALLGWARFLVAAVRFDRWRDTLGGTPNGRASDGLTAEARRFAAHVEWAARLLPFGTKCLPRAMALSWISRRRGIAHVMVFAVRPAQMRGSHDDLHAWVEIGGEKLIGDLPGPWAETLRLGD